MEDVKFNNIDVLLEAEQNIDFVLNKEKEILRDQKILRHKKTILLNEKKVIENKLVLDTEMIYKKQIIISSIESLIITFIMIGIFLIWGFKCDLKFLKTSAVDTIILCLIYSPTLIIPFIFLLKRKKHKPLKNVFLFYILWTLNLILNLLIIEFVSFNTNYNFPIISLSYSFLFFIFGSIYLLLRSFMLNFNFSESKLNIMKIDYHENKDLWEKKYAKFKEEENREIKKLNDEYIIIQNKKYNDPCFNLLGRKNLNKEYIKELMNFANEKDIKTLEEAIKLYNKS